MREMLPRAGRWIALLSVLGALAVPRTARACSCTRRSVAEAVKDAVAVFEGTALATYEGWSRTQVLRVERVYKGRDRLGQLAGVDVLGKGNSCGMTLQHGTRYLVYARGRGHSLTVSRCSRTATIDSADEDLHVLEAPKYRRNFDLRPTPDRDWLKVALEPDWTFDTGRVQRLEITVEPTKSTPRVPIAAVLALDLSTTGAERDRVVTVARTTIDALPNGAHLAIVGLSAPNVPLVESTAIDEQTRADMHATLDKLPNGKPTTLHASVWLASTHVDHAPFEAAAKFMIVAATGMARDAKLSANEQRTRLESAASRIHGQFTRVDVFAVDKAGAKDLELLADLTQGRFHDAGADIESAVADDVARWQRVVGGLATVELVAHGGAQLVGAYGVAQHRSRGLGLIRIGSLFEGETVSRTLYFDIPDSFDVGNPLVSVRLRYLDPSGTSAQAFETIELNWDGPP